MQVSVKNVTGSVLFLSFLILVTLAPTMPAQELRSGKENPLIGPVSLEQLFDLDGWFGADFISYMPDRSYTALLKEYLEGVTIKCYLGTWCEDSEIQVPRMLKVLQQGGVDPVQFQMYGLDEQKNSPAGEEDRYAIDKVPTFVFVYQDREIGRIVEEPIGTLEKDMVGLIMKAFPEKYPFYEQNRPKNDDHIIDESDGSPDDTGEIAPPPEGQR